jgi:hypothetical protein
VKKIICLIVSVIILSSCSPEPQVSDIQTAIAETSVAQPTLTFTSSPLPTSTNTLNPTDTSTSTMTLTPTSTDTATPVPPATLTQQVHDATQTQKFEIATMTQVAKNQYATVTSVMKTSTAKARNATATEIASYEDIYWKDLATYPYDYLGQKVVVRGRIFNVLGNIIQIYFAGTYEALYVTLQKNASGIYENDTVTVYGIVGGEECFENAYGAEICQPSLEDAWYTKP